MDFTWSKTEKKIAKQAFGQAYDRKCQKTIEQIKSYKLSESDDIWKLGAFIKKQEKVVDRLFDYRYSQLILVFSLLIKENLLSLEDLDGLNDEKLDKIKQIIGL